jgi:serine/threonine protein kinase
MNLIGKTILGTYKVKALLGKGAFGETYLGESKNIENSKGRRFVAIKVMEYQNATEREKMLGEVKLLMELESEFVVKCLQHEDISGVFFIILEFLDGTNIWQRYQASTRDSTKEWQSDAVLRVGEAAMGIKAMHDLDILHCDIHPGNIVIDSGKSKIVDFGLSRYIDSKDKSLFNIEYTAPEVPNSGFTFLSDIFSLGCLLYFALTGSAPPEIHDRKNFSSLIRNGIIDNGLANIVSKATHEQPNERYENVELFLADLARYYPIPLSRIRPARIEHYWYTYWLSKLIDISCAKGVMSERDWMNHLKVSGSIFSKIRLGVSHAEQDAVRAVEIAQSILRISHADAYRIITSRPDEHYKVFKILESAQGGCVELLRDRIIDEWNAIQVRHLPSRMKQFVTTTTQDPRQNISTQQGINFFSALSIPDLESASSVVFELSSVIKQMSIETDPMFSGENHIKFSNNQLSKWAADILNSKKFKGERKIRIVEGGVGGAHSAFILLKELGSRLSSIKENNISFEYQGFELVPRYAWMANEYLSGDADGNDNRTKLFSIMQRNKRLSPLNAASGRFVENASMSAGFRILADATANQSIGASNKVDIVMVSYAMHHVPDGSALRNYLSAPLAHASDPWRSLSSNPESKKKFTSEFKNALNTFVKNDGFMYYPTTTILPSGNFFGPVRTLWYNLNWHLLSNQSTFHSFRDFINREFQKTGVFSSAWLEYIKNARRNLFSYISRVLQPDGILLIADPDGTGKFNQNRWTYDAEATTANFWTRQELENEIRTGFYGLKIVKSENIVMEKGTEKFVSTPDSGDRLLKWNIDDMGYVLVAQKV